MAQWPNPGDLREAMRTGQMHKVGRAFQAGRRQASADDAAVGGGAADHDSKQVMSCSIMSTFTFARFRVATEFLRIPQPEVRNRNSQRNAALMSSLSRTAQTLLSALVQTCCCRKNLRSEHRLLQVGDAGRWQ